MRPPPLFPVRPSIAGTAIRFALTNLTADDFCTPFYDERKGGKQALQHADLDEIPAPEHSIPPAAFVFHLSHCGSTLLAQVLSALPAHRVISEAELINSVFLSTALNTIPEELTRTRLRKAIALLTQPLHAHEQRTFIKFASWNVFHLPLIRACYPDVPCIFLHRHPLEVIRSLKKDLTGFASWIHHGAPLLASCYTGLSASELVQMPVDDYLAHMLRLHLEYAHRYLPAGAWLGCYPDWLNQLHTSLLPWLNLSLTDTETAHISERTRSDAKKPASAFVARTPEPALQHTSDPIQQLLEAWSAFQQQFPAAKIGA